MRQLARVLLASLAFAATLHAQGHPQTRKGFTISFGLGGGSASFSCDVCTSDRETAGATYLRIGGAVRPDVIIAGQVDAWTKKQNAATLTAGTVDFIVQWYPAVTGGFFVSGGVGIGSITTTTETFAGTLSNSKSGLGYNAGLGYDIRVKRNFSITPFATYFATSTGSSGSLYGGGGNKMSARVFSFGVGFTWH
jgi:hypothetical protein